MRKHGILINMTNDSIAFWPGRWSFTPLTHIQVSTEITPARIVDNISPIKIMKKGSTENVGDFLQVSDKKSSKKRRRRNKAKRKIITATTPKDLSTPIDIGSYRTACKLKGAQVFAISIVQRLLAYTDMILLSHLRNSNTQTLLSMF